MIKVLFIARATLFTDPGGDTIQILKTAEYLRKNGVDVTVKLTNEKMDYEGYDLLHFFNIIRPADVLAHMTKAEKPFVISTIYVDYAEFERRARSGLTGMLVRLFPPDAIEYLKTLARAVIKGEKIMSMSYLFLGQRGSINRILSKADMLLPNSHSELRRLKENYSVASPYHVIPNAIDPVLFNNDHPEEKDLQMVLCVGRIEGRKNQLNLVRAVNGTKFKLIIIGAASPNQQSYYEKCKHEAGSNVEFINKMNQEDLIKYYRKAKVHALPSWFETTGLSSLEAAAMGCNIVITDKGDTREYFEEFGFYCDPVSPESIRSALERASATKTQERLINKIFSAFTWKQTSEQTLSAYEEVLRKKQ